TLIRRHVSRKKCTFQKNNRKKRFLNTFSQILQHSVSNYIAAAVPRKEDNLSAAPRLVPKFHTEQLRLPDLVPLPDAYCDVMNLPRGVPRYMEPGLYDADGGKLGGLQDVVPETRVVIEFAGVTLIWGVFEHRLRGGFRGEMTFHNCPGTAPITSFFN